MAVFDATNADEDVGFICGSDLIDFSLEIQATNLVYEWRTSGGNIVTAYGDFTYNKKGDLISGVVSSIDINLSNDSDVDVEITSIDNADIIVLLQDHESFWREILIGDDQFLLPTGHVGYLVGDDTSGTNSSSGLYTTDGGDDRFLQTLSGKSTAYLRGDFESFRSTETIYAGSDHFVIDGATSGVSAIMGDAANIREGTLVGGDDIIDTGGVTSGRFIIYGDVASIENGSLIGGHDKIFGGDGGVTVHGDSSGISSGLGYSVVVGGDDEIQTGIRNDSIYGDASTLRAGSLTGGDDVINAGGGRDHIYGDLSSIFTESGSNEIFVAGNDTIYGGDGGDWIRGDIGTIHAGAGILASNITFGNDTLFGGNGNDEIYGDIENDNAGILNPQMGGDDYIDGGNGRDYMDAGGHINGDTAGYRSAESGVTVSLMLQGAAQDTVGAGLDTLIGFENLTGSNFADTLMGDNANNVIKGCAGSDTINGSSGEDNIKGGKGRDNIQGGDDADVIGGGRGGDHITGGNGNDTINGGRGRDSITGGEGNDIIIGGSGNDELRGGGGKDEFMFLESNSGNDTITGFQEGTDTLTVFAGSLDDVAFNDSGDDLIITHATGVITLEGLAGTTLIEDDFNFLAF